MEGEQAVPCADLGVEKRDVHALLFHTGDFVFCAWNCGLQTVGLFCLFLAALGLCCCARGFSSCGAQASVVVARGL